MAGKRVWTPEQRRQAAESAKVTRAKAKLELFTPSVVGQAKKIIKQLLESNKPEDRRFAAVFILEQMYGKAAAKPLDKPANPKDDKLGKLISGVMLARPSETVIKTDDEPAKPN